MIVGVGIDLCEVPRLAKALERPGFLDRLFTETEAEYIRGRGRAGAESAAGCFAAKEAALKALGTGLVGVALREVEVVHESTGKPVLRLHGAARERAEALGAVRVHLSITHTRETAAAVVVLEE